MLQEQFLLLWFSRFAANCINALEPTQQPVTLVNIATEYADKSGVVNIEKAIEIWCQQMKKFVKEFPDSIHKIISKQVHMLKSEKERCSNR